MTENELREKFRVYFTTLQSAKRRENLVVDKQAEWAQFVAAAITNGQVPAAAQHWRCPRSLKSSSAIRKAPPKRSKVDNTASKRSERRAEKIREAGGATVIVRFPDKASVDQLDALVASGEAKDRTALIRTLVSDRYWQLQGEGEGEVK